MSRWLRVLFISIALFLAGFAGLHFWIKSQVKQQLSEKLPKSWILDYRSMGLNIFKGGVQRNDINLQGKESWLGSTLVNMLVRKDSHHKGGKTRHSRGRPLRDPTKSFFNYLWLNPKDGLIDTLL